MPPEYYSIAATAFALGAILTTLVSSIIAALAIRSIRKTEQQHCDDHRQAALGISYKLAVERQKVAILEEQIDGLMNVISKNYDPADYWKRQP